MVGIYQSEFQFRLKVKLYLLMISSQKVTRSR